MSNIVSSFLDLTHEESLVDRVSKKYKINRKTIRCTIDLKSLGYFKAMDFDKEQSFLKAPAQRPDYLIVSWKPGNPGRVFMIEFSKGSNKRESTKTEQIQAGFSALQSQLRRKDQCTVFRAAEVYPVYWGPTKKGEKDRIDPPKVSFLHEEYKLRYLGCKESILNLCASKRKK